MTAVGYIESPHLPQGRVGLLVLGGRYRGELERPLSQLGVSALWLPDNTRVDGRLAGHADLVLFHAGGRRVVSSGGDILRPQLEELGFEVMPSARGLAPRYPADAGLNGCLIGKRFIHNTSVSDGAVLSALPPDTELLNVRQGYAKCSVCVVDSQSIITSDEGIARAAEGAGLQVLRISPGYVELPGFSCGFIGGASFKLAPDLMAFTGRLDRHLDWVKIGEFLYIRGISITFLTDRPAFDIGSAVPLTEV